MSSKKIALIVVLIVAVIGAIFVAKNYLTKAEEGPPVVLEPTGPLNQGGVEGLVVADLLYWHIDGELQTANYSFFTDCSLPVELIGLDHAKILNGWVEDENGKVDLNVQHVRLENDVLRLELKLGRVDVSGTRSIDWKIKDKRPGSPPDKCKTVKALPVGSGKFPYELYGRFDAIVPVPSDDFDTDDLKAGKPGAESDQRRLGFKVPVQ